MLTLSAKQNIPLGLMRPERVRSFRVTTDAELPAVLRENAALLLPVDWASIPKGFGVVLVRPDSPFASDHQCGALLIDPSLLYLGDGDVIRLTPDLHIRVVYRRNASTNSLLVTERCNSLCLMCSQPPRDVDDSHLVDELLDAIPLFDPGTREVGITGGEPTLLGARLFDLVRSLKSNLPHTGVHILSNGRNFKQLSLAQALAALHHPDLMIGIPLYSDIASLHDYVVQADGAFDETVRGILNLKRCGVRVEVRVVVHAATYARLPALARFIARNLQFVDQVALMGLEMTGFTKANLSELWIDPVDYQAELADAVHTLHAARVKALIYNHQLCLLDPEIRRFAVRSISDWKNEYMPECDGCDLRQECGGFFSSAKLKYSAHIKPQRRRDDALAGGLASIESFT
ncbi:His-Xaa-Ser system radical SAM maturase HxsC [Peristeroidobacter agariperforans]|uniref:His-Xaa-Ser system radical SAM maturase HxsC n=1 Tax=Peristeroidobacter agariperforans TaxID=268404 RepID=UPI0018E5790D|nr:His-Xaa-Ser system radical SAM maturase HxsC [Peristeroidobacter agariperforans]